MTKLIAVVDAYSSGAYLAQALRARGARLVHVQTSESITSHFLDTYRGESFERELPPGLGLDQLASELADVNHVVAGTETGVLLAEQLADRLGLPSNRPELIAARRDKFEMIEAVRRADLRVARHVSSSDRATLLRWVREEGTPVVIKPPASAGSDGVRICRSEGEVSEAISAVLGARNKLGLANDSVVAESFLEGSEYIVDTVSWDGQVVFCDICRSDKKIGATGAPVYERIELIDWDCEVAVGLRNYFGRVLRALGIENGPAHGELIGTSEGPCLVEVAARLSGAHLPEILRDCVQMNSVDVLVTALTHPEQFADLAMMNNRVFKQCSVEFLSVEKPGTLRRQPTLGDFGPLSSEGELVWGVEVGAFLPSTVDLFTAPGFLVLKHDSLDELRRDQARIAQRAQQVLADSVDA